MKHLQTYCLSGILTLISLIVINTIHAQTKVPALERIVTLDTHNENVIEVLHHIERQTGCSFSYNANLVPVTDAVTVKCNSKTVREALDKIFVGRLQYKAKGDHIILVKAPVEKKTISGYVENSKGEKISGASVYDTRTLASATTNEFGYYEMKIKREYPAQLVVSKSSYSDTIVPLQPAVPTLQNIVIEEKKDTTLKHVLSEIKTAADTFAVRMLELGDKTKEYLTWNDNARNIEDSLHRKFQLSFVPFVGTNGLMSGNVVNDWSINIIGGYNGGVTMGEFAGMFNVDRGDVKYLQFAGFSNIVGGKMEGIQASGFANIVAGNFEGVQLAGHTNINLKDFKGVQASGFSNINLGNFEGVQLAGFCNVNLKNTEGPQIAGFMNFSRGNLEGVQIAGFLNVADNVRGSQFGFINVADSITGIPLGFMSFVHHGYHKLELSYNELGYGNISFRTGVPYFYNIISAGAQTDFNTDTVNWTFGYGVGTAPKIGKRVALNFDLTASQLIHGNITKYMNQLARLDAGVDVSLTKGLSLYGGVSLNGYFFETNSILAPGANDQHSVYSHNFDSQYSMKSWIGWKVGIRFF